MNKNNSCLTNGIILSVVFCYLCIYFSVKGMWNAATVIVIILVAALSAGQYLIWYKFFRIGKKNRKK